MTSENSNQSTPRFEPLSPGESIVWSKAQIEGTFRKRKASEIQITTNRIALIDYKHPENSYALPMYEVDDVIVFDQQRVSQTGFQMAGTRNTFSYYAGTSKSQSKGIGSVYIISNRFTDIMINGVNDPTGLSKLVIGLSKQRKAQLEEQK
jgi:hypothetical protein